MPINPQFGTGREVTGNYAGSGSGYHSRVIQAGLSTQIVVSARDANGEKYPIGAIQTLTPTETRPLGRISEVGTDGVIQITPTAATTVDLAIVRLVFDYQRLPAAFQRGFRHIHSARLPFDIDVRDYNPYQELANINGGSDTAATDWLETTYINCWLQNYTYTYDQGNYIITENATVWAEGVYTKLGTGDSTTKANTGEAETLETTFSSEGAVSPMSSLSANVDDYNF